MPVPKTQLSASIQPPTDVRVLDAMNATTQARSLKPEPFVVVGVHPHSAQNSLTWGFESNRLLTPIDQQRLKGWGLVLKKSGQHEFRLSRTGFVLSVALVFLSASFARERGLRVELTCPVTTYSGDNWQK
jgi:hypothetical protein